MMVNLLMYHAGMTNAHTIFAKATNIWNLSLPKITLDNFLFQTRNCQQLIGFYIAVWKFNVIESRLYCSANDKQQNWASMR